MARLKIKKRFSLAYLGDAWKDGYLEFESFTAKDVADNISTAVTPTDDPTKLNAQAVKDSYNAMLVRLEDHFISGKFPTDDGKLENVEKGELGSLPAEIIQEAISFLSQSQGQNSQTQSVTS